MNPYQYFNSLETREKEQFAKACDSSLRYFKYKLFHKDGPKRVPGTDFLARIALNSNGNVSTDSAIRYFVTSKVNEELLLLEQQNNKRAA